MSTPAHLRREARVTGGWYLLLAVAGYLGYLFVRGQIFVAGDAGATVANLVEREGLARLGIAAEMTMVVAQVLVALWFYRLFRAVDAFAAASLVVFGCFNAVVGLVGAIFSAAGLGVALEVLSAPGGDVAGTAQLLYELRDVSWDIGGLFFGLWLLPMGYLVIKSRFMPRLIGYLLLVNAAAYFVGAYVAQTWPDGPTTFADTILTFVPGELVFVIYLLVRGARVRSGTDPAEPSTAQLEGSVATRS